MDSIIPRRARTLLFSSIILRQGIPEFRIPAALLTQQFIVSSGLHHLPCVEHRYLVAETTGGQPMADIDSRLIPGNLIEFAEYFVLIIITYCNSVNQNLYLKS